MRILHFKNNPITIKEITSGGHGLKTSGGWIAALLGQLMQVTDYQYACVAFGNVKRVCHSGEARFESFVIPGRNEIRGLNVCRDLVNEWKPDLIHIHGTERAYGLLSARGLVDCPTVISLQGLLGPSSEWYHYFGNRSLLDVLRMHRFLEIPTFRGHWTGFRQIRKAAKREREIVQGNHHFLGRTEWDRAYIKALNPTAQYLHVGELLRKPFWLKQWSIDNVQRHRIIFTNAGHPRKGAEIIMEAVALLQHEYPDIQVYIAGYISRRSGYGRYLRKRIASFDGAVVELGQLNAEQMTTELIQSHVFVSPSYIDNSPNSICEAQLVGMPVVSTYTGGVSSLIEERRSGLFISTGDAPMLAARLREVFENDELAKMLGSEGRKDAFVRHDPETIIKQILSAYENIMHY